MTAKPRSLSDLFWSFTVLSMQGFGGVMAIAQRELVERKRWLSREGFLADWSVAHVLPGPNIVNLAVIFGDRHFGVRGSAAAVAGLLVMPLVLILLLAWGFSTFGTHPAIAGALKGVGVVVAALIAATALKLMPALAQHPGGRAFCVAVGGLTLVAILMLRWPLPWVLLGVGGLSVAWTAWRLRRSDRS